MKIFLPWFFATFVVAYLNKSAPINFVRLLVIKYTTLAQFLANTKNSNLVVSHFRTNFMKVIQNQTFCKNPSMLCVNWSCKIVMRHIMRLLHLWALFPLPHIWYYTELWWFYSYILTRTHGSSKITFFQFIPRNTQEIRLQCFKICL